MSFSTYTTIITYLVAGVGMAAISLVEAVGITFTLAVVAVMAVSLVINTRGAIKVTKTQWNVLAVIVFIGFLVDYKLVSGGSLIVSLSRFLTVLVALKLFDLNESKDYVQFFALVLFQILAAASSTVSPLFFAVLSAFIMLIIWAMIMLNIKRDFEKAGEREQSVPRGVFGAPFFLGTIALTVSSIIITLVLFFLIPRMAVGFFETKTLNTLKVSGFSERMDLGVLGPVKQDPSVVMRVGIPFKPASLPLLYFRGSSLDTYDGTGWNRTISTKRPAKQTSKGTFELGERKRGALLQNILLEPLDTAVLFAASRPVTVSGKFSRVMTDGYGSISLPSPPFSRSEYSAWSVTDGPAEYPEAEGEPDPAFLQTPKKSGPVATLAEELTRDSATDLERAVAVKKYLTENFRYTLNPKRGAGENPLEDFLFYSKEGYCEHYATSMAILLRHAGIPSRVVTGYIQGQWNEYGKYFLVRQLDAHSWVEAYIEGAGWTTFDPTPVEGLTTPEASSRLALFLDSIRWRWSRYIVNYTLSDQLRVGSRIETSVGSLRKDLRQRLARLFSGDRGGIKKLPNYAWAAALIVIVVLVLAFVLKTMGLAAGPRASKKTPDFYRRFEKILKKMGFQRKASETAMELALRSGLKEAEYVAGAFGRVRYGNLALDDGAAAEVMNSIERLKRDSALKGQREAKS